MVFKKVLRIERMGREISTTEDEFELSLELSVGGCYGKSDPPKQKEGETTKKPEENLSRRGFSCVKVDVAAENGYVFVDVQKKREIQAQRRREARMKRELKKSKGLNNGSFVEAKLILETQKFQTRVQDRETQEMDGISEHVARKKEEIGRKKLVEDLNILFSTENKISASNFAIQQKQNQFFFPRMPYFPVGNGFAYSWVVPPWGTNVVEGERSEKNVFRAAAYLNGNGSRNSFDSGSEPEIREALSKSSAKRISSVVSDQQSSSQKGGCSSDTGSHSSSFDTHQNQCDSRSDKFELTEVNHFPGQSVGELNLEHNLKVVSSNIQQHKSGRSKMTERFRTNSRSETVKPSYPLSKETSGLINKPPKPPNGASAQNMHYVSTTGNGPNGKTIRGLLYKYTKSEVSIVCLCHGSTFSPTEFIEHAGGINISHPLKHITVVPSTLG